MLIYLVPVVLLVVVAFIVLKLHTSTPANNSSVSGSTSNAISLLPSSWQIRYSPGLPSTPSAHSGGGWQFDFPLNTPGSCPAPPTSPPNFNVSACKHVDYVTTPTSGPLTAKAVTVTFNVVGKSPVFDYHTAPNNTAVGGSITTQLLLEHSGDSALNTINYRWFSVSKVSIPNADSFSQTLNIPLTPDQWVNVNGQLGSSSPELTKAFNDTLANIAAVGLVFGGGFFAGHGAYLNSGSATFVVTNFAWA